ncbi:hypothetical protein ABLT74_14005, partial [Acinetobacter johnsonii]
TVIRRPIGCTIDFRCGLIHLRIILWNKPLEIGLCNKAGDMTNELDGVLMPILNVKGTISL